MDKKEEFKEFLRSKPEILNYLRNNKDSSMQKLYEVYDVYGNREDIWKDYINTPSVKNDTTNIKDLFSNIDVNSLQEHIKTAQKALGFIEELTSESAKKVTKTVASTPRPLDKFFGD